MEHYNYNICLISLVFPVLLIFLLIKEFNLYRLFSTNSDEMRKLLANDPKRFHISIVYLMTYMTHIIKGRSKTKLEMIVNYIVEVIPQEFQLDAIKALDYLTKKKINDNGKIDIKKSKVSIREFKKGNYNKCIKEDDPHYYIVDIHANRMAEEMSLYLSEKDRIYLMYMLYRIACAEGRVVEEWEKNNLKNVFVDGLKIDNKEFNRLVGNFSSNNEQVWYDEHFGNDNRYPASIFFANIFHGDNNVISSSTQKNYRTSVLSFIKIIMVILCVIVYFLSLINELEIFMFIYCFAIIPFNLDNLDSETIPVLRTKIEDVLQRKKLIIVSVSSIIILFCYFYLMFRLCLGFCPSL